MPGPAVAAPEKCNGCSIVYRDGTRRCARDIICLELKARVQSPCLCDCDGHACSRPDKPFLRCLTVQFFPFAKLLFGEVSSVPQKVRNVE
jgi:hypothetical protein